MFISWTEKRYCFSSFDGALDATVYDVFGCGLCGGFIHSSSCVAGCCAAAVAYDEIGYAGTVYPVSGACDSFFFIRFMDIQTMHTTSEITVSAAITAMMIRPFEGVSRALPSAS